LNEKKMRRTQAGGKGGEEKVFRTFADWGTSFCAKYTKIIVVLTDKRQGSPGAIANIANPR
jgi:hypothetical protein